MSDALVALTLVTALGCGIGLTTAYHVPHNDALAAVEPMSRDAAAAWRRYVAEWTRWNHVWVAAGLGAAAALTEALRVG